MKNTNWDNEIYIKVKRNVRANRDNFTLWGGIMWMRQQCFVWTGGVNTLKDCCGRR